MKGQKKQIKVSAEVWRKLMEKKIEGGYHSIDEVLRDILQIE